MNANYGFTRLEKRKNGKFETLAVNARGYVDNQPMTMTVEANGNMLIVMIDGDPVFAGPVPTNLELRRARSLCIVRTKPLSTTLFFPTAAIAAVGGFINAAGLFHCLDAR